MGQLSQLIFNNELDALYKVEDLETILKSDPFGLSDETAKSICEVAFKTEKEMLGGRIMDNILEQMKPWRVMSEEDEGEFDRQLVGNFTPKGEQLHQKCLELDEAKTGYISSEQFYKI